MLEDLKANRTVFILKYFSLASLTLSIFVYLVHALELKVKTDSFLFLHVTSIVVSISMFFHASKRKKAKKSKWVVFRLVNAVKHLDTTIGTLKVLYFNNKHLVTTLLLLGFCLILFAQYHLQNFFAHMEDLNTIDGPETFIELGSGHWIVFSALPTLYFFLCVPLFEKWDALKIEGDAQHLK